MNLTATQYAAAEGWLQGSLPVWSVVVAANGRDPKVPPAIWKLVEEFVQTDELSREDYVRLITYSAGVIGYLPPTPQEPRSTPPSAPSTYKPVAIDPIYTTGTYRKDGSSYMDMSKLAVEKPTDKPANPIELNISYNDVVDFLDRAVKAIKANRHYQIGLIIFGLLLLSWMTGIG